MVTCLPVSSLASTAAAREQQIDDWIRRGWIDAEEGMDLADMPDLDEFRARKLSHRRIAYQQIGRILDENEWAPPEPIQDLAVAAEIASRSYLAAVADGAPKEALEMLRRYIEQCLLWLQQAQLPAPASLALYARQVLPAPPAVSPEAGVAQPLAATIEQVPMEAQGAPPMPPAGGP